METHHVDPNTVGVWRWHAALTAVVLALPLLGVVARAPSPTWLVLPIAYVAIAAYCVWVLPSAHYEALEFGVDDQGITIHRGIFWRSRIALPRVRVQHSDVSQGPLQRRFGVATLKLYTAGSRYTKIELPGLAHDDALALRDALISRGGDSGV
jgi:membrane protein YdbS with pleckstrin-like domain